MSIVLRELRSGKKCRIFVFAKASSNEKLSSPYLDFHKSLKSAGEKSILNKVAAKIQLIADEGPIQNESGFRTLQGDEERNIWELVLGNFRLFMFRDEDMWVCLNGFRKTSNSTPIKEITQALKWRQEYLDAKHHGQLQILNKS